MNSKKDLEGSVRGLSRHCRSIFLEEMKKTTEPSVKIVSIPAQKSNRAPFEYKTKPSPLEPI